MSAPILPTSVASECTFDEAVLSFEDLETSLVKATSDESLQEPLPIASNDESKESDIKCDCRFIDVVLVYWQPTCQDPNDLIAHVKSIKLLATKWTDKIQLMPDHFALSCVTHYNWNIHRNKDAVVDAIQLHKDCLRAARLGQNNRVGSHECSGLHQRSDWYDW